MFILIVFLGVTLLSLRYLVATNTFSELNKLREKHMEPPGREWYFTSQTIVNYADCSIILNLEVLIGSN